MHIDKAFQGFGQLMVSCLNECTLQLIIIFFKQFSYKLYTYKCKCMCTENV